MAGVQASTSSLEESNGNKKNLGKAKTPTLVARKNQSPCAHCCHACVLLVGPHNHLEEGQQLFMDEKSEIQEVRRLTLKHGDGRRRCGGPAFFLETCWKDLMHRRTLFDTTKE